MALSIYIIELDWDEEMYGHAAILIFGQ